MLSASTLTTFWGAIMIHLRRKPSADELSLWEDPAAIDIPTTLEFIFQWVDEQRSMRLDEWALYDIWERWFLGYEFYAHNKRTVIDLAPLYGRCTFLHNIALAFCKMPRLQPPNERQKAEMIDKLAASRKVNQQLLDSYEDSMYEVQL